MNRMSRNIVCYALKKIRPVSRTFIRHVIKSRNTSTSNSGATTSFTGRTHTCGELRWANDGDEVTLCGWLQHQRLDQFIVLRDWHGSTQIIIPDHRKKDFPPMSLESVLKVKGQVKQRPDGQTNKVMKTGDIEVILEEVELLNPCKPQLPFTVQNFQKVNESLRMEYRYLDMRNTDLQHHLRLRSDMVMKMRQFLCNNHGFVEIETPTLFKKTPGGAKEFVVPSRHPGKFYSLPQSPQQFKQLLMVGGFDRYVQIARCYRDEGSKPDRQPEFTQVDIEMSFVTEEDIMSLVEEMLSHCWPEEKGRLLHPFQRISYHEAMTKYGVDKPDTRFDMKICDVSEILKDSRLVSDDLTSEEVSIQAIKITEGSIHLSNKDIKGLKKIWEKDISQTVIVIKVKEDGCLHSPFVQTLHAEVVDKLKKTLTARSGDLIFITLGKGFEPHSVLGKLRLECAHLLEQKGVPLRSKDVFNFLWVTDFPLFLPTPEGLESAHHPFTAPRTEDKELLYTQPLKVKSQHYDLVLNGSEVGGGSIRIHNAEEQKYVLNDILQEDSSELNHLLEALESGCPPHGGIALGLDRLMSVVCGTPSIRDVIAFPKSHDGKDSMSKAPSFIPQAELDAYHIKVKDS